VTGNPLIALSACVLALATLHHDQVDAGTALCVAALVFVAYWRGYLLLFVS
jgi:hypothetical protein